MATSVNSQILKEIKSLNAAVQSLILAEAARVEREKSNDVTLMDLEHTVNGNGKAGLKVDVQLLQSNIRVVNLVGLSLFGIMIADVGFHIFGR